MLSPTRTTKHAVPVWDAQGYTLGYVTKQTTSIGACRLTGAERASYGHLGQNPMGRNVWGWLTTLPAKSGKP